MSYPLVPTETDILQFEEDEVRPACVSFFLVPGTLHTDDLRLLLTSVRRIHDGNEYHVTATEARDLYGNLGLSSITDLVSATREDVIAAIRDFYAAS